MVILRTGAAARHSVRRLFSECVDRLPNPRQPFEKTFQSIQRQHIRPVAFRNGRVRMRFDKKTVDAGRDRCARNGFDHFGLPAGHAARLVGLLQRMGNVHNHGITEVLHRRDAAHIDDQVVITEGRAPVGQHHVRIARIADFPGGEGHRFRSEKLSLFDIDDLAGLRGGNQQIGLAAQESRYLQHVDVFGGDRSLFRLWISVTTGTPNPRRMSASSFSAFSSPIPLNESSRERFALRYDALNI